MHRNTKGESPCVANVRIKDRRYELRRATRSPLQIISNKMVSTYMHVMLVVMLFIT